VLPSEAQGVYTETLDSRWEASDKNSRDKVLEVMRWEDSNLRRHIEKHRLDLWAQELWKAAGKSVDETYDMETAAGAAAKTTPQSPKVTVPKSPRKSPVKRQTRASAQNGASH